MLSAVVVCALVAAGAAALPTADPRDRPPPGRYVVTFERATPEREQRTARERVEDSGGEVHRTYRRAVNGFAASLPTPEVDRLRRDPDVASVEPDAVIHATDQWSSGEQLIPPWGLDRIDQRSGPRDDRYAWEATGAGVTAFVVDSGLRADHAEFGGRVAADGFSVVRDGRGTGDCSGHGTHVAGILGGSTMGVAKQVRLVPVRVLDCDGIGLLSDLLAAVDWVTAHRVPGRSVANLSIGGPSSAALDQAVAGSIAAGVPWVAAAGNRGGDSCAGSPGRIPAVITVGASTTTDAAASFSDQGRCLDLYAPGSAIRSAWPTSRTATSVQSGTSMAAPHAAGVLAALLQDAPGATPGALAGALVDGGTDGVLDDLGAGSPNVLLHAPAARRLSGSGAATTAPLLGSLARDAAALAVGGLRQVESLDTDGSATITTQDPETTPGCTITRPRSAAAGRIALLNSLRADDGCLHFARAGRADLSPATERLVYVPFATENVSFAIRTTSNLPRNLTLDQLRRIYRCQAHPDWRPMLPARGSDLREHWISLMYPGGQLPVPRPACLLDGVDGSGRPIAPNDGRFLRTNEIVPFSVAQYTAQVTGVVDDVRGASRIGQVDGRNPFSRGFGLQRTLYHAIPEAVLDGTAPTDLRTRAVFVGSSSMICRPAASTELLRHGFRRHPGCGSTGLRTR